MMSALSTRAARLLLGLSVVYASLVATHRGEFWPFSIYPMFSRAGRPWARALVLEQRPESAPPDAAALPLEQWPGAPFPLEQHAISQNDLSSLVQRAERWTDAERGALAGMFAEAPCRGPLLVLRVEGALSVGRVRRVASPIAWLGCSQRRPVLQHLLLPPTTRGAE